MWHVQFYWDFCTVRFLRFYSILLITFFCFSACVKHFVMRVLKSPFYIKNIIMGKLLTCCFLLELRRSQRACGASYSLTLKYQMSKMNRINVRVMFYVGRFENTWKDIIYMFSLFTSVQIKVFTWTITEVKVFLFTEQFLSHLTQMPVW